ncbi:MAG: alpha-D-ribose 1-methylphosphonate 5-triphosphate diphosphatase [Paracoccaceae bacterium]
MGAITITNGRVLRGGRLLREALYLRHGLVQERPLPGAEQLDARGALVLPGIVDVHGDAFERQIMPRPGVAFDLSLALLDTDRQLLANGITTAYHALSVSWEPGLRSLEMAGRFVAALRAIRPRLGVDTRLHLRWETFVPEAIEPVATWLAEEAAPILAFNDHTTGDAAKAAAEVTDGAGGTDGPGPAGGAKIARMAARAGLTEADYRAELGRRWTARDRVEADKASMAEAAHAAGAALFAHDELTPAARQSHRALGVHVSEFPMNRPTAEAARAAGEHTILGAPNVLRGGSHNGALSARQAVRGGFCTVLASDYYYPALLQAPFRLAAEDILPVEAAWQLVSAHAAEAAGLGDRGALEPGLRADVILVDDRDPEMPTVQRTIVGGRKAGAFGE